MITVFFNNDMDYSIAYGLWQWDVGEVLRIKNVGGSQLSTEVHFSFKDNDTDTLLAIGVTKDVTYTSTSMNEEGIETTSSETIPVMDVVIPRDMLCNNIKKDYNIYVFIYFSNEETGESVKKVIMPVKVRPKPSYISSAEDKALFQTTLQQINVIADELRNDLAVVSEIRAKWQKMVDYFEEFKGNSIPADGALVNEGDVWTYSKEGARFKPLNISETAIEEHNTSENAHMDIRDEIESLAYSVSTIVDEIGEENSKYIKLPVDEHNNPYYGSDGQFLVSTGSDVHWVTLADITDY